MEPVVTYQTGMDRFAVVVPVSYYIRSVLFLLVVAGSIFFIRSVNVDLLNPLTMWIPIAVCSAAVTAASLCLRYISMWIAKRKYGHAIPVAALNPRPLQAGIFGAVMLWASLIMSSPDNRIDHSFVAIIGATAAYFLFKRVFVLAPRNLEAQKLANKLLSEWQRRPLAPQPGLVDRYATILVLILSPLLGAFALGAAIQIALLFPTVDKSTRFGAAIIVCFLIAQAIFIGARTLQLDHSWYIVFSPAQLWHVCIRVTLRAATCAGVGAWLAFLIATIYQLASDSDASSFYLNLDEAIKLGGIVGSAIGLVALMIRAADDRLPLISIRLTSETTERTTDKAVAG